jgi:hypothetical protein
VRGGNADKLLIKQYELTISHRIEKMTAFLNRRRSTAFRKMLATRRAMRAQARATFLPDFLLAVNSPEAI